MAGSRKVKKEVSKKTLPKLPGKVAKVIRSFAVSHNESYSNSELEMLHAYIHDYFDINMKMELLMDYIKKEQQSLKNEPVLRNVDSILFSGNGKPPAFKLGSAFCRDCGMYKNYRKECPYCGHHEVTF
ncbi:MAG: hypothetical protein ACMUIG_02795 [Thermoplasmatota archaeon]